MSTPATASDRPRYMSRLYAYSRAYRRRLIAGILLGALGGGSLFGLLTAARKAMGFAFGSAATVIPEEEVNEQIAGMALENTTTLGWASLIMLAFFFVRGFGGYFSAYFINWVGLRVVQDIRQECFAKLQRLQLSFFGRMRSGDLISRVTNDTTQLQNMVSTVVSDLVQQPFAIAGALIFLISTDWLLALVSLVIFPLCIAPVLIFGRKVRKYSKQSQERLSGLASILQENVAGVRVVKAFGMEEYEQAKFDNENERVFSRLIKNILAKHANNPIMEIVTAIGVVGVLFYSFHTGMPSEDLLTFLMALIAIYQPAKRLGNIHMEMQKAMGSAERIFSLLDEPIDVEDAPDATPFSGSIEEVTLRKVSFRYASDSPDVLSDISLTVKAGETVALVGNSGGGKSTLISLIPRFFDVSEGSIALNGQDIRTMTMKSLRQQISVVTQDTFLFNESISANIAYGQENFDMQEVEEAARRANAHRFIEELDEGYDTIVGERGNRLSGGQKQRIAIARAIFSDAPILILDEATSALDNESERLVQEALNVLMQGRTTIAIAHRLSTIQHADRILVLDSGKIVEEGSHDELLQQDGPYKRLHSAAAD